VTQDTLLIAALWSYGFAAAAFCVFALRMMLGWRGGVRAKLLLATSVASALWAGAEALLALRPDGSVAVAPSILDMARYTLWFTFLYNLVGSVGSDYDTDSSGSPHSSRSASWRASRR
jgi:hypothetical protein